jgi:hypothetical protein
VQGVRILDGAQHGGRRARVLVRCATSV